MSKNRMALAVAVITSTLALVGCGVDSANSKADATKSVTLMTHDSWNAPKDLIKAFEQESGYTVKVEAAGDAGEVTNKLILSKDSPTADVVFGIDNTFGGRAVAEGVLAPYTSPKMTDDAKKLVLTDGKDQLTPIDYGDVCINVDNAWFQAKGIAAPTSLDDLLAPEYKDLFVTPGAATSSPGMAFMLATIAKYGEDGWADYWKKLMANGAKLTSGWSDAYSVDFSAGEGKGARPIVLSYASSPPFTIPEGGTEPTTSALLNTCFRQIEYAGVVKGAANADGAKAFIDFISSKDFQESIPDNMYMYPASGAALPDVWAKYAPLSSEPLVVDPQTITKNRETWLKEWSDVTSG